MVSPIAREAARSTAATMPEIAAGKTMCTTVVILRAPMPYDASRNALGTARIASSLTEATRGVTRKPTAMPAAAMLNASASGERACTMFGPTHATAKKPRTMLGIPASTSRIGLSTRRTPGCAYSAR